MLVVSSCQDDTSLQQPKRTEKEYLYVPVKDKHLAESPTTYKTELEKRDAHIYTIIWKEWIISGYLKYIICQNPVSEELL